MITIDWKKEWLPPGMIAAMIVIGIFTYPFLPQQLPMHWNVEGKVDGYLPKTPLSALAIPFLSIASWVMFILHPYFDPKKEKYAMFAKEYSIMKSSITSLFLYIYIVMILNSIGYHVPMEKAIPAGMSVLFIILGNLLGKIRQNYFVGIKLPWTLSSEQVWNKTHRLGGKLMVLSGILGLIGTLFPPNVTAILLYGGMATMIGITVVYSYIIFKKNAEVRHGKNKIENMQ